MTDPAPFDLATLDAIPLDRDLRSVRFDGTEPQTAIGSAYGAADVFTALQGMGVWTPKNRLRSGAGLIMVAASGMPFAVEGGPYLTLSGGDVAGQGVVALRWDGRPLPKLPAVSGARYVAEIGCPRHAKGALLSARTWAGLVWAAADRYERDSDVRAYRSAGQSS